MKTELTLFTKDLLPVAGKLLAGRHQHNRLLLPGLEQAVRRDMRSVIPTGPAPTFWHPVSGRALGSKMRLAYRPARKLDPSSAWARRFNPEI
jgi:hypothetical protein